MELQEWRQRVWFLHSEEDIVDPLDSIFSLVYELKVIS